MTDRELIMMLLERISNKQEIVYSDKTCIEIDNSCVGEDIVFNFDANGRLLDIGC